MDGDYEMLELLYDSVPAVLSELICTAFIPRPGYKFIVSDFSAIEARFLAFLAGKTWRPKVFAEGKDIYCASASQMFCVPVEKHGIDSHFRQKEKIAELALGYGGSMGALNSTGVFNVFPLAQ
jgi:DNA polymerase